MNQMGMRHLVFLTKSAGMSDFLAETLFRIDALIWESVSPADFSSAYEQARFSTAFSETWRGLLDLKLLSEYLLYPGAMPEWADDFMRAYPDIGAGLPFPVEAAARDFMWNSAPVVMVGDADARVRYFVVGAASRREVPDIIPPWAAGGLDESALSSIRKAVDTAAAINPGYNNRNVFCFPLVPFGGTGRFTGSSLGLPLTLACMASMRNIRIPSGVIATGAVEKNGIVRRVQDMELKMSACAGRFKAIFYPAENGIVRPAEGITAIPVDTAASALSLVKLYSPEHVSELALFAGMIKNSGQFVNNIGGVPHEWIDRVRSEGALNAVIDEIADSPERFADLTGRFESLVERFDSGRAQTLSNLIPERRIRTMRNTAPLSAFRWCTANLSLAKHHGRISDAEYWARESRELIDDARRADLLSAAAYFNHYFVARHNRYLFQPALPEELHRILNILEKQYIIQNDAGCPVHIPLGRLYGTICQNFGFCGPDYIDETDLYARKARTALGEGTVPEFRYEWKRQLNYTAYARLDAGGIPNAERMLCAYLDIEHPDQIVNRISDMTVWEHALAARFLADAGDVRISETYFEAAGATVMQGAGAGHPMQLWNYNMGRIAETLNRPDEALDRFAKSIDICTADQFGATMKIMAMLPLSGLYRIYGRPDARANSHWKTIRNAMDKTGNGFFTELKSLPLEEALESITISPGTWFPFNYR